MMDGIDRYEAQSIADSAARNAADDAKRAIGYDVERVADDLRRLRTELSSEHSYTANRLDELWETVGELRQVVMALAARVEDHRHGLPGSTFTHPTIPA